MVQNNKKFCSLHTISQEPYSFTVPFYHFMFSRYLDLTERHFSSDILVPFPDLSDLYSCGTDPENQNFEKLKKISEDIIILHIFFFFVMGHS